MRDRYYTLLSVGMRVADLRDGKKQDGKLIGSAGKTPLEPMLLVRWESGEEETVYEADVVAASEIRHGRRRRRA